MTRAFIVCFLVGLVLMWISLSTEHGKEVGRKIMEMARDFVDGKSRKKKKKKGDTND